MHSRLFPAHACRSAIFLLASLAMAMAAAPAISHAQLPGEGRETENVGKPNDYTKLLASSFPAGTRVENVRVKMRDGVELATDVFIPPGDGPFPVLFSRGYYGRLNATKGAQGTKEGGMIFIVQDCRAVYDSAGQRGRPDLVEPDFEMNDCRDALDWIAKQPWCNGKIGMVGASGNGINPSVAALVKHPNLVMASPSISSPYPYYYWGFSNGVRRGLYSWLGHTSYNVKGGPLPTLPKYDEAKWREILAGAAEDNPTVLTCTGGWYDIATEAVLDTFAALAAKGKVFARISPNAHAGNPAYPWPSGGRVAGAAAVPRLWDYLQGKGKIPEKSQLIYYVMGSFRDPSGPGNFFKTTDVWPVPSTPTEWYLQPGGGLAKSKPAAAAGGEGTAQSYEYDPKNPAPSLGGNYTYLAVAGPADQRPLLERKDVIHFASAPLEEPLQITGKVLATLYVSADVPDTTFIVKFTDIHPDGYQMILRESAAMGRNAVELKGAAPMEKGRVYKLEMDLWSTAIVLAKGHRLGVIITGSSKEAYQVHPNSFEPVQNLDNAPVAKHSIHFSAEHPSAITLPVVPVDAPPENKGAPAK
ncbi:X-Pro dipeptidyl-peptidase-like protein [Verrucomicrobia bacterium LW23]|nr:X-Pro dipeptidyl-peptidase-like protein [Verrucomicrobia bacterium LW23]